MIKRRDFFKVAGTAIAGIVALPMLVNAERRRGGGAAAPAAGALVDEKSAEAKAVNYATNHAKVDKKLAIVRQGVPFEKQLCNGCSLYQGKASDKQAPCTLFPGKQVVGSAWCSSWNKKA